MKRATRPKLAWHICGAVMVAGAVAICLTLPRERSLIERAQPLVAFDATVREDDPPRESIEWLADSRLLIITTDNNAKPSDKVNTDWKGHVDLVSPNSRSRRRLVGLSDLLSKPGMTTWGKPHDFKLSPDGERFHWLNNRHGAGYWPEAATAKTDGSGYREWGVEGGASFWIDNTHYLQGDQAPPGTISRLIVHDVTNSENDLEYPANSTQARAILRRHRQTNAEVMVGITNNQLNEFDLYLSVNEYGRPAYVVKYPRDSEPIDESISPTPSAIFYHMRTEKTPPLLAWLHRYVPMIPAKSAITECLWISKADGTQMHEMGHVPGLKNESCLQVVQWLPDNKRISFVYKGMMYILPVDARKYMR